MDKVRQAVVESGLLAPGDTVVCAVSGGADSMALLWALWTLRQELQITVLAAHFNHRLRISSKNDETIVKQFCLTHQIPLRLGVAEVSAEAKKTGESIELAARRLRYAFLEQLDADRIATAHHADDNCETVLLNLLRGTGLRGLCGIPPQRGRIIRPLLSLEKQELEAFCLQEKLPTAHDETNDEDAARRNRLRHQVLPLLKQENPRLARSIGQMTALLRQDEEELGSRAREALEACREKDGLDVEKLRALPQAVLGRAMRQLLSRQQVKNASNAHVSALVELVYSEDPAASVSLPEGLVACRSYDRLVFRGALPFSFLCERKLEMGMVELPEAGLRVFVSPAQKVLQSQTVFTVVPVGQLRVRCRETGDRLTLPGGTKSLKKLMIDRKLPRELRERIPVVCDDLGIIGVWSIGMDQNRRLCSAGENPDFSLPPGAVTIRFARDE